jgi:hypothetical protein
MFTTCIVNLHRTEFDKFLSVVLPILAFVDQPGKGGLWLTLDALDWLAFFEGLAAPGHREQQRYTLVFSTSLMYASPYHPSFHHQMCGGEAWRGKKNYPQSWGN